MPPVVSVKLPETGFFGSGQTPVEAAPVSDNKRRVSKSQAANEAQNRYERTELERAYNCMWQPPCPFKGCLVEVEQRGRVTSKMNRGASGPPPMDQRTSF